MLFCLGIDSEFGTVESIMTVLHDAGAGQSISKAQLTGIVCGISWFLGLIFVTNGGIYWFMTFDYYYCVISLHFVTFLECIGVSWLNPTLWPSYVKKVKEMTGRELSPVWLIMYKFWCPVLIVLLVALSLTKVDLIGAKDSARFEQFTDAKGYFPPWSIFVGWFIGLMPVVGFLIAFFIPAENTDNVAETSNDPGTVEMSAPHNAS